MVDFYELIIPEEVARKDKEDTNIITGIHRAVLEFRVVIDVDLQAASAKRNIELVFRHNGIAAVVRED
jgi:hypothetical protein